MKTVILCGGKGTRLHEETAYRPKPLVEIGGRPILWHVMMAYAHQGYKDFILLLGYRGEQIKEYFLNFPLRTTDFSLKYSNGSFSIIFHNKHSIDSWSIMFLDTGLETQTGGRIARAKKFLTGEDFFLTYADGVSDINLQALYQKHQSGKRIITVTGIHQRLPFGFLETDTERITGFSEKPLSEKLINGGFFVCSPQLFNYLSEDESCILEGEPLQRLAAEAQVTVYEHTGFWQSMDTYKQVLELNELWAKNPPWRIWSD